MSGQIRSDLHACCQAAGSCYTIPLYYMCSQATILNLLKGTFNSFISVLSGEYFTPWGGGGGGAGEKCRKRYIPAKLIMWMRNLYIAQVKPFLWRSHS